MNTDHANPRLCSPMAKPVLVRSNLAWVIKTTTMLAMITLYACSGSGKESELEPIIDDGQSSEAVPPVLIKLANDESVTVAVPDVVYTQTMANTGIRISYTESDLRPLAPATQIEKMWVYMQECVGQVAPAPLVLVRSGPAVPFTPADDVVRNDTLTSLEINSVPIASASTLYGAVIQISVDDFDGSLGTPSYNLRSIMGRHLWLSAELPERDYPFDCASSPGL